MKARFLGSKNMKFTSKDGVLIEGKTIYTSFPAEGVDGEQCEKFFVRNNVPTPENLKIGEPFEIEFDHRGKIQKITKA